MDLALGSWSARNQDGASRLEVLSRAACRTAQERVSPCQPIAPYRPRLGAVMRNATLGRILCLVVALVSVTGCVPPQPQRRLSWGPGTRVRVSSLSAGDDAQLGSLVRLVGDTLTMRPVKRSDTI